jgi:hypothetical protein
VHRCVGTWVGAGLASTQILAHARAAYDRRAGAGAVNDFLLAGFNALTAKANDFEQQTGRS